MRQSQRPWQQDHLLVDTFDCRFTEALEMFGATVDQVKGPVGDRPTNEAVTTALAAKSFKLVVCTHVDTSTGKSLHRYK